MRAHLVYRAYAFSGALLYVGSTMQLDVRLRQHRDAGNWWRLCREITTEAYADLTSARAAETAAIANEQPVFNMVGTGAPMARLEDFPTIREHQPHPRGRHERAVA